MQALRQLGGGIIIAAVSILLVVGGISLAIAESAPSPAQEVPVFVSSTSQLTFFTPTLFFLPTASETSTIVATQTATIPSLPPSPTICPPPPSGWTRVIVGVNDSIYTLAQRYATSEDALKNANCLTSVELTLGNALYVPPVFSTAVVVSCSPPFGWVKNHVVQPGENLFRIALSYGLTYPQLQQGNCMGSSITIYIGQQLWVPNISTFTPIPGVTLIFPTSTSTPTATQTFVSTITSSPTITSTFISTSTSAPSATNTSIPAPTHTPSLTPFPSP